MATFKEQMVVVDPPDNGGRSASKRTAILAFARENAGKWCHVNTYKLKTGASAVAYYYTRHPACVGYEFKGTSDRETGGSKLFCRYVGSPKNGRAKAKKKP